MTIFAALIGFMTALVLFVIMLDDIRQNGSKLNVEDWSVYCFMFVGFICTMVMMGRDLLNML